MQSLREALVALQQPDAANLLTGNSPLQVQTVLGLIKQMNDGGWRFAPALPGDEAAYLALRDAMSAVIQLEKRRVCDRAGAARTP